MDVLDANRSRPAMCWKRCCGYSTQARNGTCCRKAMPSTDTAAVLFWALLASGQINMCKIDWLAGARHKAHRSTD